MKLIHPRHLRWRQLEPAERPRKKDPLAFFWMMLRWKRSVHQVASKLTAPNHRQVRNSVQKGVRPGFFKTMLRLKAKFPNQVSDWLVTRLLTVTMKITLVPSVGRIILKISNCLILMTRINVSKFFFMITVPRMYLKWFNCSKKFLNEHYLP